jgi:hypothetical protein
VEELILDRVSESGTELDTLLMSRVNPGCGDIIFLPPGIIYRVCNLRTDEKLVAWVFFAESSTSYWPDGTPA